MTVGVRRRTVIVGGLIAAVVAGLWWWQFTDSLNSALRFVAVTRGVIDRRVSFVGALMPVDSVTALPKVTARVLRIHVIEGQRIHKGQLLATLDAADLQIDVERKQVAAEKAQQRVEDESLRPSDRHAARLDLRTAQLELKRAKSLLAGAALRSPIDGTVVQVGAREGEVLSSLRSGGGEGFLIAGARGYVVRGEMDEVDAAAVREGAASSVKFDVAPHVELAGTVRAVPVMKRFRADGRQAAMFELAVLIQDPLPAGLTAGHSASVSIRVGTGESRLLVPVTSVVAHDSRYFVAVKSGRTVTARLVTVGEDDGKNIAILEGLGEGDVVASGPLSSLLQLVAKDAQ